MVSITVSEKSSKFSLFLLTVLASSGIDYDIKLWTPSANEPMEPKDKEEVCMSCAEGQDLIDLLVSCDVNN